MRKLPIRQRAVALDAQLAGAGCGRGNRRRGQNGRRRTAMGMHVRAALIGILLRVVLANVGVIREGTSVVHVLMYERVRLGELRRMQDRQLGTAEHRYGEQRRNHDLLHDLLHGAQQSRAAGSRQVAMS